MAQSRLPIIAAGASCLLFAACAAKEPQAQPSSTYGEDRAKIEDLQARYLFAMDFRDPQAYTATFAELRKIYNEDVPAWAWTSDGNPAVSPGAGPGR